MNRSGRAERSHSWPRKQGPVATRAASESRQETGDSVTQRRVQQSSQRNATGSAQWIVDRLQDKVCEEHG
ncbi:hypothetical protein BZL41_05775 [Pseudomonas sp. PIC25]|nr:hypothetical protein BZL41_05775 [Pseudomonas sp. PIC25]